MDHCCLCGRDKLVKWCNVCKHFFCVDCKFRPFWRSLAALKEHLLKEPPKFCGHKET